MTVLKALKKMFGKSEVEQLATESVATVQPPAAPKAPAPAAPLKAQTEAAAPARAEKPVEKPLEQPASKPVEAKPRRERKPKPQASTWKLEDFVVEPQEGKTRFHDFKLSPELMHAIHDLGFPYCTPIQA